MMTQTNLYEKVHGLLLECHRTVLGAAGRGSGTSPHVESRGLWLATQGPPVPSKVGMQLARN